MFLMKTPRHQTFTGFLPPASNFISYVTNESRQHEKNGILIPSWRINKAQDQCSIESCSSNFPLRWQQQWKKVPTSGREWADFSGKEAAAGASELLQLTEGHSWADQTPGSISTDSSSKNIPHKPKLFTNTHESSSETPAVQKELKI